MSCTETRRIDHCSTIFKRFPVNEGEKTSKYMPKNKGTLVWSGKQFFLISTQANATFPSFFCLEDVFWHGNCYPEQCLLKKSLGMKIQAHSNFEY